MASQMTGPDSAEPEDIEKLTVNQLKERLREIGKPVSGKRADLLSRLQAHLAEEKKEGAPQQDLSQPPGLAEPRPAGIAPKPTMPVKRSAAELAAAYEAELKAEADKAEADKEAAQPTPKPLPMIAPKPVAIAPKPAAIAPKPAAPAAAPVATPAATPAATLAALPVTAPAAAALAEATAKTMAAPPPAAAVAAAPPAAATGAAEAPLVAAVAPGDEILQVQEKWDPSVPDMEKDAESDSRPRLADPVVFHPTDCTLNAMPSKPGGFLMAMTHGGLHHLLAGARASVGLTKGRYMFEAQIVENVGDQSWRVGGWGHDASKHMMRIGFSTKGSAPIMGDSEDSICYESTGALMHNDLRQKLPTTFGRGAMAAVVLNVSDCAEVDSTISLFVDGKRVAKPQKLPKPLQGKPLFPTITFRGVTVHTHFGPEPRVPLPFVCRSIQDAARQDVVETPKVVPKDGKREIVFPVCLPDEGAFDWLDWYKQNHPDVVEISDRTIAAWALRSGVQRKQRPNPKGEQQISTDRPDMSFEFMEFEEGQVKQNLAVAASAQKRNVVVMEVRESLLKEGRKLELSKFQSPYFKRVALVVAGEPPADFKKWYLERLLKEKQARIEVDYQAKLKDFARKRVIARARFKAELIKKKMERAARIKKREEERKKAEEKGMVIEEPEVEEPEVDENEEMPDEEVLEKPGPVELNEYEKQWGYQRPGKVPDVLPNVLTAILPRVSFPDNQEGYDEVRYEWLQPPQSDDYLKSWALERKQNTRMEDIKPSSWFAGKLAGWKKDLQVWHQRQLDWDDPAKRQALLAAAKDAATDKVMAGQSESKPSEEVKKPRVKFAPDDPDPLKTLEEGEEADPEDDVFGVEDVCDTGKGKPLFADFEFADWALLSLRFELHLLVHAFVRECGDPERSGMHPDHLEFYYGKFYKKALNPKTYGCDTVQELIGLVRDTIVICKKIMESQLSEDIESNGIFVKLTEACRVERQRRIHAGDNTVQLKIQAPAGFTGAGVAPTPKAAARAMPVSQTVMPPVRPGGNVVSRPRGPYTAPVPDTACGKGGKAGFPAGKGCGKGKMGGWGGWGGGGMYGPVRPGMMNMMNMMSMMRGW